MNIIASILVAFALIFGTATATTEAPVEVSQASPATLEEVTEQDTEYQVLLNDSTVTWTDYMMEPQTSETISYTWVMSMDAEPENLPATRIALESYDLPGVWHIYEAMWLHQA